MSMIYKAGKYLMNTCHSKQERINLAKELSKLYKLLKEAEEKGVVAIIWVEECPNEKKILGIDSWDYEESFELGVHVDIHGHDEYTRGYIRSTDKFSFSDERTDEYVKCSSLTELIKLLQEKA